ncbi:MAG: calcium-binding protein [Pirellulales bacterium]
MKRQYSFERLEDRRLMTLSVTVTFTNGHLHVDGSGFADAIYIFADPLGRTVIDEDGKSPYDMTLFGAPPNSINSLLLTSGNGADFLDLSLLDGTLFTGLNAPGDIVVQGGASDDDIFGSELLDWLYGEAGDDIIYGHWDDDAISGGSGNDTLYGERAVPNIGGGDDLIFGGDGNDSITGGTGFDEIFGDNGSTLAGGGSWDDTIYGDDAQWGNSGDSDVIDGEFGDDEIHGDQGDDELYGGGQSASFGGGDDRIYGDDGDDTILGDAGISATSVASGNDTLSGGNHNDSIDGGNFRDDIYGDPGDDTLIGGGGDDFVQGGSESDSIRGGAGADTLWGEGGCDNLYGDAGKDSISGGAQDDTGDGGADNLATDNLMDGGPGRDVMTPEEPFDADVSDPCDPGFAGPEMLEGAPVLIAEQTVGYRDQRFALRLLSTLSIEDFNSFLRYYGMNEEERTTVRRWRDMFLAGDLETLLALVTNEEDCGCGDWSM